MKYSFLVPVYNVEQYLEQCIDSMLSQTYKDFEIILVDDGSTDRSGEICDNYAVKYPNVVSVVHKENGGHTSARLEGIRRATGDVCIFVDSDDFVESNLLQEVDKVFLQDDGIDIVMYSFCYYSKGNKTNRKQTLCDTERLFEKESKKELYETLMYTPLITSLCTKAVKTEIYKNDPTKYDMYYDKVMGEDLFMSIYLITAAEKIKYINETLYNYRIDNQSVSRNFSPESIVKKNTLYIYERFLEYLPIWEMDNEETVKKLKARWLDEVVYTFNCYYEAARNAKQRKAVVDFDWSSMLPEGTPDQNNEFESSRSRELFKLIHNKKYAKIRWIHLKKRFYQTYKKLKLRIKMGKRKEIVFIIKVMSGGGAERVISLLSDTAVKKEYDVTLILTHQKKDDAVLSELNGEIKVLSLPDEVEKSSLNTKGAKFILLYSRLLNKLSRVFTGKVSDKSLVLKYLSYNYKNIGWLKGYFKKHNSAAVVAFLYDSIFYSLLSVTKKNKLVISERGDPCQCLGSKTTMAFLKNEFKKSDGIVFQSPDVSQWYRENTGINGTVIFNPVKSDLPEVYDGEREKKIVNFCRLSSQKNIPLLLDAFEKFYKDFPEYELYIYGNEAGNGAEGYFDLIKEKISTLSCKENVNLLPARADIHEVIKSYGMFVSSSDFEGMSNSMLEALALGLPCVCTDCPAGGAAAVIEDGVNGLLVPVGDSQKMYEAMKKIAGNPDFAKKVSQNSVKIRKSQSVEKIIEKWMEIING